MEIFPDLPYLAAPNLQVKVENFIALQSSGVNAVTRTSPRRSIESTSMSSGACARFARVNGSSNALFTIIEAAALLRHQKMCEDLSDRGTHQHIDCRIYFQMNVHRQNMTSCMM